MQMEPNALLSATSGASNKLTFCDTLDTSGHYSSTAHISMSTGFLCHYLLCILLLFHVKTWSSLWFLFIIHLCCYIGVICTLLDVTGPREAAYFQSILSDHFHSVQCPFQHEHPPQDSSPLQCTSMNGSAFMRLEPQFEVLFCTYS